jgi:hypothetical protein
MNRDELVQFVRDMCAGQGRPVLKEKPWKYLDGREWVERIENAEWERESLYRYCNDKYGEEEK